MIKICYGNAGLNESHRLTRESSIVIKIAIANGWNNGREGRGTELNRCLLYYAERLRKHSDRIWSNLFLKMLTTETGSFFSDGSNDEVPSIRPRRRLSGQPMSNGQPCIQSLGMIVELSYATTWFATKMRKESSAQNIPLKPRNLTTWRKFLSRLRWWKKAPL